MTYEIKEVIPTYGVNYAQGWSFASYRDNAHISHGIAWFTRWDQMRQLPVSHVGFVAGPNSVVEATRERGVVETPLENYFDDPHVHIYFRKPREWTPDLGKRIAAMAMIQIGDSYDTALIKAHLAAGTFLGHWLSRLSQDALELWLCQLWDDADSWICSELCAWTMQQFQVFDRKGVLARMPCTITPPEYIWDPYLFKPFEKSI